MFLRRVVAIFIALLVFVGLIGMAFAAHESTVYFFYGQGCPHCAIVENYFEENRMYDAYAIDAREIYFNRENALLYTNLMSELGVPREERGVPAVVMGETVIVGDQPIISRFEREADVFLAEQEVEEVAKPEAEHFDEAGEQGLNLTIAAVLAGAVVDAINPCAFAVLIILMTTILASGDHRKALRAGLAFSVSIFLSYFLMGLGLYRALTAGSLGATAFRVVGWLAIILGLLNLKDWLWYGKGFLMEVPMSWRPRLKGLLQSVTNPAGAFGIGFLVSLFLLPCTSGPYVVILGMLAKQTLQLQAMSYLVIYNLVFVSPMLLITFLVYRGLSPQKVEELRQKRLKTLHLVAGILLLAMGIAILKGWV